MGLKKESDIENYFIEDLIDGVLQSGKFRMIKTATMGDDGKIEVQLGDMVYSFNDAARITRDLVDMQSVPPLDRIRLEHDSAEADTS